MAHGSVAQIASEKHALKKMSKPRRTYPTSSYVQSSPANQQPVGSAAPQVPLYSPNSYTTAADPSQLQNYPSQAQQAGYPPGQYQNSEQTQFQQPQQPNYQQAQSSYQQPLPNYQQSQYQQPQPFQDPLYQQQQPVYQSGYQPVDGITQGVAGMGVSSKSQANIFNLQAAVPPVDEVLDFTGPKIGLNVI